MKHKLLGIRSDLLDMADKFKHAERLSFGDTVAVCIDAEHMDVLVKILRTDAKVLGDVCSTT